MKWVIILKMRILSLMVIAIGASLAGCGGDDRSGPNAVPGDRVGSGEDVSSPEPTGRIVARVLGRTIRASEIGLGEGYDWKRDSPASCGPDDPGGKLGGIVFNEVFRDYVKARKLEATEAEIRELREFMDRSPKADPNAKKDKLSRIEKMLKSEGISKEERDRLKKLEMMLRAYIKSDNNMTASQKAQVAREVEKMMTPWYAAWVEAWKGSRALYEEFGGLVRGTKFGPIPVGARTMLVLQYEKRGELEIMDKDLERQFWVYDRSDSGYVVPPGEIDFTPYWKESSSFK